MRHPLAIRPDAVDLVAPLLTGRCLPPVLRVTTRSPRSHRRAVYRLARYFRLESGYDAVQYGFDGAERDPGHTAFLWVHPEAAWHAHPFRVPCVGAACFRARESGPALQWVWVHPFFRRRGLLTDAWPDWRARFGAFAVEGPVSAAMRTFLGKIGHPGPIV